MLVDFRVKNYALIDELEMNFKEGLNVLTGETGAGKSIIIGALEILLGARASSDLIRHGKESAYIEAVFEPNNIETINKYLTEVGIEPDPSLLLLSREIRTNGRNRTRINGQLATATMIKEISPFLVDIHGQHEHQSLLNSSLHIRILDDFMGEKGIKVKDEVKKLYNEINKIEKELTKLQVNEAEKAREIDLLEYQVEEIDKADLKDGEIEKLNEEYKIMTNMEEIYATTGRVYNTVNGEDFNNTGFLAKFGSFRKEMERFKDYNDALMEIFKEIEEIYYRLENLSFLISDFQDNLEFDKGKLDKIEVRLNVINSLQRKYGETVEDILEYRNEVYKKLQDLKNRDEKIDKLEKQKATLIEKYDKKAKELSKLRKNTAKKLEKKIINELQDLAMENTVFKVDFKKSKRQEDGIDFVEFLISTNKGEELKPLTKIASGGELSRIMLALKSIIAHHDQVESLVFDEVDSGVGGKTAQKMAEKLAVLAQNRQVICITHLPQIASMGDHHFFITKETQEERTYTRIIPLDEENKHRELARMLGGVELTDTTLKHAEEMLKLAKKKKNAL